MDFHKVVAPFPTQCEMTAAEAKFFADGYKHSSALYDDVTNGKKEFRDNLNFAAYRQGRDPQYLGVNGKNYYAKPWGNDSSNIQAVLNGPAYWKRVYYRENIGARFAEEDAQAQAAAEAAAEAQARAAGESTLKKSASDSVLAKLPQITPEDGYAPIKDKMRTFVERQGKPHVKALQAGERLNFFNTLGNKYHMKAGGRNLAWNVSKQTHRSTKTEMRFIVSNYFRTDTTAVLAGCGSLPAFDTEPKH